VSHLSQAATAEAEVPVVATRSAAYTAAIVQTHLRKLAFGDKHLALMLFVNHGCFSHVALFSPSDSSNLIRETN
jgi:hypothetical protein